MSDTKPSLRERILGKLYSLREKTNTLPWPLNNIGSQVLSGVIALIGIIIILTVGLVILYQVQNSVPTAALSSTQQSSLSNFVTSLVGAFQLAGVLPIVFVAGLIIGAFFLFFSMKNEGGAGGGQ